MKKMCNSDLLEKYPKLLKGVSYIECGDGWYNLLDNLCKVISHHIKKLPEEIVDEIYAVQIKEKFGTLRFYMNQETPFISGAIDLADSMSSSICEECGLPGRSTNKGWIKVLCEEHEKKGMGG